MAARLAPTVLAAAKGGFSKHDLAGTIAVVVGLAIVGLGIMRVTARVAGAAVVPLIGLAVVIVGILFFTRTI